MYQKTNRNKVNLFVRECIWTAVFALLEEKEYDDITITEIIKRAGVSRMGFYRNYDCKDGVLEDFILTAFQNTVTKIEAERPLNFKTHDIIVTTLENFKLYAAQIKLLLDKRLDLLILNCYKKAFFKLYPDGRKSEVRYFYNEIFIAGLFALECAWVRGGMKQSPDRLARLYSRILVLQSKI